MTSASASSRSAALGVIVAALLGSAVARAQSVPVELSWSAPPECPTRDAVLSRVGELVGSAANGAPPLRAEGEIRKLPTAYELRLVTEQEGRRGERLVRSAQCEDLRGVAAVTLTLLLTSGGTSDEPPPPTTPPPPPPPPAPVPAPVVEEPSEPEAASPRSWRVLLTAPQLALTFGPLPKPAPSLSLGVGVEGAWWSLRVLGQWGPEQHVAAPLEGYGALTQRGAVSLWACSEHRAGALSVAPCLVGSAARLRATGDGPFVAPSSQVQFTGAVGAGAIGRARATSWLSLMVGVTGQVELSRSELWLETIGRVRRLAPVSAVVVVGPEWIF